MQPQRQKSDQRRTRLPRRGHLDRWSYALIILFPIIIIAVLGLARPRPLSDVSNIVYDWYQRIDPRPWNPQAPVRIIVIDDESLTRIGQWPWPRSTIADLVARLGTLGAAAVTFDIVFAEPDASSAEQIIRSLPDTPGRKLVEQEFAARPGNDAQLVQAIAAVPTIFGAILTQDDGADHFPIKNGVATAGDDPRPFLPHFKTAVVPLPILSAASAGVGALNWLPDRDQIVRRVPIVLALGDSIVPSLAAETLRAAQNASTIIVRSSNASGQSGFGAHTGVNTIKIGELEIPTGAEADLRLHFSRTEPRRFIPAWKVLAGAVDRADVQDRIMLIGVSGAGLSDQHATPVNASVIGVEIQAQVLESIVASAWLRRPDWAPGLELALAVALALMLGSLLPRVNSMFAGLGAIGMIAAVGGVSWYAFSSQRMLFDPILPMSSIALAYVFGAAWLYHLEQRQKREVRDAFGRFVSPEIVARLADDPSKLVLGGESKILTVMFCDVRGFTSISERYDVHRLTQFMNEYFTPLTDTVLASGGTVDKYIGDALMAFWNAPLDVADHAKRAARTALAMVNELRALNDMWRAAAATRNEEFHDVKFGVGLATGECCVGNLGSIRRFDYSVLGDTVNLASRLDSTTKTYRVDIIASEITRDSSPDFAWLEIDSVRVKGKTEETRIFYLAGDDGEARSTAFIELAKLHTRMLHAYRQGKFETAALLAREAHDIAAPRHRGLYEYYSEYCDRLEK